MALDRLPPLRAVIAAHGLRARRSLGQNFLLDLNLTARIARAAGPLDGVTVLEIGPGPGGLTRALLAEGAAKVVAIERDERCLGALAEIAAIYPERLAVVAGDALAVDHSGLVGARDGPCRIVANLPYNIATPLFTGWLGAEPWPPWYDRAVLMFQNEVADRIVAAPGGSDYGRLSVLAGWRGRARKLFTIDRAAFTPPPKVTSAVVEFTPLPLAPDAPCVASLAAVTAAAFGQRRKMLRSSLKSTGADVVALLRAAGIDGSRRAEDVPVEGYVAMARVLEAERAVGAALFQPPSTS